MLRIGMGNTHCSPSVLKGHRYNLANYSRLFLKIPEQPISWPNLAYRKSDIGSSPCDHIFTHRFSHIIASYCRVAPALLLLQRCYVAARPTSSPSVLPALAAADEDCYPAAAALRSDSPAGRCWRQHE